jgi:REP element-mobilizing transposase RayT
MIHAHLVFTTKKRGKVLSSQHLDRLKGALVQVDVESGEGGEIG